jgi:formylglycine-generating enzyme required for sulfatase activity
MGRPPVGDRSRDESTILPAPPIWLGGVPPSWAEDWGRDAHGPWVRFRVPNTSITQLMRWCPPGTFTMGSSRSDEIDHEGPRHRVTITQGFWMFDTVCTEALWFAVTGHSSGLRRGASYPVTNVTWNEVQHFVHRINGLLPGLCISLPSEARWEYACRAGTDSRYYFSCRITKDLACYASRGPIQVRSLPSNAWGLHEMHGNVWEWCVDHWYSGYSGAPTDGAARVDREGTASRVYRGGSWSSNEDGVRASARSYGGPAQRDIDLGFRCVRVQVENSESNARHAFGPEPASWVGRGDGGGSDGGKHPNL